MLIIRKAHIWNIARCLSKSSSPGAAVFQFLSVSMNITVYTISSLSFIVSSEQIQGNGSPAILPHLDASTEFKQESLPYFLKLKQTRYKTKRLLIFKDSARAVKQIFQKPPGEKRLKGSPDSSQSNLGKHSFPNAGYTSLDYQHKHLKRKLTLSMLRAVSRADGIVLL